MRRMTCGLAVVAACGVACGQSLYERPVASGGDVSGAAASAGPETLEAVSLTAVEPPQPRTFAAQDLITIIVSERTSMDRSQTVETEKDYNNTVAIRQFVDILKLLELRVEQGERAAPILETDLEASQEFEGEGTYERDDIVTTRVTARVLEVKPNGTLLLEARTTVTTDEEEQVITLSGLARSEDVTDANTVQSNQLFDLNLNVQHSGQVERTTRKGVIPRIVETILNF